MTPDVSGTSPPPLIFISAAEPSADLHGAALIRAVRRMSPEARFVGVAGPRMVAAGCDRVFDMTSHSAMLLGVIANLFRGATMMRTCEQHLRRYPFDAAVVIDSPVAHLPLAGRAHALGIPVLYYIAPQMWAWGAYRIHKLRNRVDRAAVILPFEEEYFRSRGVDATYVGHPLADLVVSRRVNEEAVDRIRGYGQPVIALLPGSRKHVVASVLPGQLEVAERIASTLSGASFGVSVANPQVAPLIDDMISSARITVRPFPESHAELISAADLVLVASGTTTLEVAFYERPMIVMYQASRLFYHLIGRWLLNTQYYSLPNILAGREVVPEFMPYYRSTIPIADRAINLLRSPEARAAMTKDLAETVEPLRGGNASERTAQMLLDMIDHSRH